MNKELAQRWVDALESGEYDQGQQWLRTGETTYCCLGVLCDITKEETGGVWARSMGTGGSFSFLDPNDTNLQEAAGLPKFVRDYVGLNSLGEPTEGTTYLFADNNGEYTRRLARLSTANDQGESFVEIAHAIRERFINDAQD